VAGGDEADEVADFLGGDEDTCLLALSGEDDVGVDLIRVRSRWVALAWRGSDLGGTGREQWSSPRRHEGEAWWGRARREQQSRGCGRVRVAVPTAFADWEPWCRGRGEPLRVAGDGDGPVWSRCRGAVGRGTLEAE
jgi:hypothetical protein